MAGRAAGAPRTAAARWRPRRRNASRRIERHSRDSALGATTTASIERERACTALRLARRKTLAAGRPGHLSLPDGRFSRPEGSPRSYRPLSCLTGVPLLAGRSFQHCESKGDPHPRGKAHRLVRSLQRQRHLVECLFHSFARFRAVATRCGKVARIFFAVVQLACAQKWLENGHTPYFDLRSGDRSKTRETALPATTRTLKLRSAPLRVLTSRMVWIPAGRRSRCSGVSPRSRPLM